MPEEPIGLQTLLHSGFDDRLDKARIGLFGIAQLARLVQAPLVDTGLFQRKTVLALDRFRSPAARDRTLLLRFVDRVGHGHIRQRLDFQRIRSYRRELQRPPPPR